MAGEDAASAAVKPMADLLATALIRDLGGEGKTWVNARDLYVWERQALDWLAENCGTTSMNDWTANLLEHGYPPKPFTDSDGSSWPAGKIWSPPPKKE